MVTCFELLLFLICLNYALFSSARYDSSLQFHPSGSVLQIEYAKNAVKKGGPILAVRCDDGILIVALRKFSSTKLSLTRPKKIFFLDEHICMVATGLLFDAKAVVDISSRMCTSFRSIHDEGIPIQNLAANLGDIYHRQTRVGNSRPVGAGFIIGGYDEEDGFQIYRVEPEGSYDSWRAISIGENSEIILDSLSANLAPNDEAAIPKGTAMQSSALTVSKAWDVVKEILETRLNIKIEQREKNSDHSISPQLANSTIIGKENLLVNTSLLTLTNEIPLTASANSSIHENIQTLELKGRDRRRKSWLIEIVTGQRHKQIPPYSSPPQRSHPQLPRHREGSDRTTVEVTDRDRMESESSEHKQSVLWTKYEVEVPEESEDPP